MADPSTHDAQVWARDQFTPAMLRVSKDFKLSLSKSMALLKRFVGVLIKLAWAFLWYDCCTSYSFPAILALIVSFSMFVERSMAPVKRIELIKLSLSGVKSLDKRRFKDMGLSMFIKPQHTFMVLKLSKEYANGSEDPSPIVREKMVSNE